jgi:hypothetical protein
LFYQFELVNSTVWLRCLPGLFLLILGHVRTRVFLVNCTPVSLHMLKCSCAHTLSCLIIIIIIINIISINIIITVINAGLHVVEPTAWLLPNKCDARRSAVFSSAQSHVTTYRASKCMLTHSSPGALLSLSPVTIISTILGRLYLEPLQHVIN